MNLIIIQRHILILYFYKEWREGIVIILYFIVIFFATTIGAITGLGGGVIIKPILDFIGFHNVTTIGFYSSCAVFTMAIVSIVKQMKAGFLFENQILLYISMGSCIGGVVGENIFNQLVSYFDNCIIKITQALLLFISLILIIFYTLKKNNVESYRIKNNILVFLLGVFLGTISIFLGIGGGPLNVSMLALFFSFQIKQAVIYSLATIIFAQVAKIGLIVLKGHILNFDFSFLPFILLAAILGGFFGTNINQRMSETNIKKSYLFVLLGLCFICLYNMIINLYGVIILN